MLAVALLAGCGDSKSARPTLAVTPQPTATAAICEPTAAISLPSNFPPEIPLPNNLVVFRMGTTPSLHIVGRVPADQSSAAPHGLVAFDIVQQMQKAGWRPQLNTQVDGADYDLIAPDGRDLHINAIPVPACKQVELAVDAKWITG